VASDADSPDARDDAVATLHEASPAVVEAGDESATLVAVDGVETESVAVEADGDGEGYRVEPDLVGLEGEAYVDGDTVVALTESARDAVLDRLEDATPASLGVDRADETALVADLTVTETDDGFEIAVDPSDAVELGADADPDTEVLAFTHDELGDIADETTAYSLIPGRVYLNLEGREPRGSVPEDEYDQLRTELKEALAEMEGPNGEPVADQVVTKEEAYRGDHDDIAPDLTVVPNHGFDLKSGFKGNKEPFVEYGARNGMHSFDNATLVIDDEDARISDADLYDITPTILDLMDIDYDRGEFDGSSLV